MRRKTGSPSSSAWEFFESPPSCRAAGREGGGGGETQGQEVPEPPMQRTATTTTSSSSSTDTGKSLSLPHLNVQTCTGGADGIGMSVSPSVQSSGVRGVTPVVVLFSWLNAERRQMRRYEEFYLSRGFRVLTMVASNQTFLSSFSRATRGMEGLKRRLYQLGCLKDTDPRPRQILTPPGPTPSETFSQNHVRQTPPAQTVSDRHLPELPGASESSSGSDPVSGPAAALPGSTPLVVHTFSNGGLVLYACLLMAVESEEKEERVGAKIQFLNLYALICDSGPSELFLLGYPVVFSMHLRNSLLRWLTAVGALVFFSLDWAMCEVLCTDDWYRFYMRALRSPRHSRASHLFIFSSTDRMIPAGHVRQTAGRLVRLNFRVSTLELKGSDHVQHMRMFPHEYTRAVEGVLREAGLLAGWCGRGCVGGSTILVADESMREPSLKMTFSRL
uniref:Uncharacterized protein n=1 Tax=Chromera velia CCMP2878 TaxID=1169474 RepID=A0A0G4IEV6_9ALVE|eukprot:Cvel_13857.t1-p1 / transcript=Cvel_13857.t1 / gene=Cvel_13857 / organism=Chromera_velia_CCMP2878 / gene_product=Transmembrane protein 53, putative / transcript_product=Transmembrane protein 53, putative / location=Cvel_scaffold963:15531-16862(-) / protein_length=444 / sequence_SO=supercontig / SO=protein_coding / is_pseudo=false